MWSMSVACPTPTPALQPACRRQYESSCSSSNGSPATKGVHSRGRSRCPIQRAASRLPGSIAGTGLPCMRNPAQQKHQMAASLYAGPSLSKGTHLPPGDTPAAASSPGRPPSWHRAPHPPQSPACRQLRGATLTGRGPQTRLPWNAPYLRIPPLCIAFTCTMPQPDGHS